MRRFLVCFSFCVVGFLGVGSAAAEPQLHGYGGRSCVEYLDTWRRWGDSQDTGILDYFGYQQWMAGLVSGLSLATGEDVLRGAEVEGMMRRTKIICEDNRKLDVFTAVTRYLRELSQLS